MVRSKKYVLPGTALLAYILVGSSQYFAATPSNGVQKARSSIKISPRSVREYSIRANAYRELGQFREEISDLTSAIKLNPNFADLYQQRADAYFQLGRMQNTIMDCTKALSLNPAGLDAYSKVAAAYEQIGMYDRAIEVRTKLVGLDSNDAFNWCNRANDYEVLGQIDQAQDGRKRAMELASPSEQAQMQLCYPLTDFGNPSFQTLKTDITRQLQGNPVVLQFHYDDGGHISVPAQVNGHPITLMLDTGFAHSEIGAPAMPRLAGTKYVQLQQTKANGESYSSRFYRAQQLQLGHLALKNVAMSVGEKVIEHNTLGGFLGGNILENFVLTIDYAKKQIILANSFEPDSATKSFTVPMRVHSHGPFCDIRLSQMINVAALLDTGSPCNLSADSLIKPILTEKLAFKDFQEGPWLGKIRSDNVQLKNVEIGAINFRSVTVDVFPTVDAPNAAAEFVLGNSFLSSFKKITFDYPSRRVIFEPRADGSKSPPNLYCEGRFYSSRLERQHAADALSKAMSIDKEFAPLCYDHRASVFISSKQYKKALQDLSALTKLEPENPRNYCNRAFVYGRLGQYEREIADDSMAIRLKADFQNAYYDRAWAYHMIGKAKLAEKDLRLSKKFTRE